MYSIFFLLFLFQFPHSHTPQNASNSIICVPLRTHQALQGNIQRCVCQENLLTSVDTRCVRRILVPIKSIADHVQVRNLMAYVNIYLIQILTL